MTKDHPPTADLSSRDALSHLLQTDEAAIASLTTTPNDPKLLLHVLLARDAIQSQMPVEAATLALVHDPFL